MFRRVAMRAAGEGAGAGAGARISLRRRAGQ
jgi:hypothetical protein